MFRALFTVVVLSGTMGLCQTTVRPNIVRRVAPEKERDPKLEAAIQRAIEGNGFSYSYDRVNLQAQGAGEILVALHGADYCGSGGCTSLVFTTRGQEYQHVTQIALTRPPIIVSSHSMNGWRDLIVFVSGGGIQPGYYAVLRFDGKTYPDNPTVEPAVPLKKRVRGTAYLSGSGKPEYDI